MNNERPWKYRICRHGVHNEDCLRCLRERLDFYERWYNVAHEMHKAIAAHIDNQFKYASGSPDTTERPTP